MKKVEMHYDFFWQGWRVDYWTEDDQPVYDVFVKYGDAMWFALIWMVERYSKLYAGFPVVITYEPK